jgi:hypothetical protein
VVKIEKDVPIPRKWPLDNMQVNDSFEVPEDVNRSTITVYATRYGKKTGKKFTIRKINGKLRCWRIA